MPLHNGAPGNPLETSTRPAKDSVHTIASAPIPALTILCHPDPDRVGERSVLTGLVGDKPAELSRLEPRFAPVHGGSPRPLEDPHLSRRPFTLTNAPDGGLGLDATGTSTLLLVNGEPLATRRVFHRDELARGLVLVLADRVALVLRATPLEPPLSCAPQIVGESAAVNRVRREILRVADLDFPVLLRGESGTGKELVARAIHDAGPRRERPYLALNIGAIPRELAASELFGAARGAFTGAHQKRRGFFERARGGTLFLDEIGVAPPEIQVLLLRALETGQIQPVGSESPERVDVRVLSATDADLEAAIAADEFRSPLLHRLAGYEIVLPPLRDRREDFGRLFFSFLRDELTKMDESERLRPSGENDPWVPANLVARLALHGWPGNVRQLKNVVRQLAVASRGVARMEIPAGVERLLADVSPPSSAPSSSAPSSSAPPSPAPDGGFATRRAYRPPSEVSDDEIVTALRAEGFNVSRAASRLDMSKGAFYKRMDQCPLVRKASELGQGEIEEAGQRFQGDVEAMAASLEVSPRGLRLRMRELGLR